MALVTQFHNELGNFLGYGSRMVLRTFRATLKAGETLFGIARPPFVEGLAGYAKFSAYLTDIHGLFIPLKLS